jgi:voltage-gated potassium channel
MDTRIGGADGSNRRYMSHPLFQEQLEKIEALATRTFTDEPFTKLVGTVLTGALLFYRAEFGHNPKVKSYADALVYISTCASVGYGDIFAVTPAGKLIGSAMMTVGPAMANAAFLGGKLAREQERAEAEATQQKILVTLERILAELAKS